ncbi:4Fe-4S binding protein [Pelobacter propionicus]|uniref:4Fe-4S ferredoxin, iron-sulfur binding domain protein n=1 Tax=Pelobacter propionicus (strain DSM 2379 / NBRC 103807 / OttBd1) TaxID=338966 RepID=A1AL89_PELPD|nr:4Fe-4S binding protein [Pelobacter propionicus]ABK98109.1 4Fe-4S ferredoxin, iron-sulfur binding domain protein [Pelobacter propionicus DSM 2379]
MGHLVGKDVFRRLGRKLDGLEIRVPWNEKLHAVLKELYSAEEAELIVRMPYGLSTVQEIERASGQESATVLRLLGEMTRKGLVMDLWLGGEYRYTPSPMIVGLFEFTLMRVGPDLNTREWARLLHDYMDEAFCEANWGDGSCFSIFRTLPHEEALRQAECAEILDYDKASALIAGTKRFSIGLCSCRHEMLHLGEKSCDTPLESCTQFGYAAEMMIRNGLGREVGRREMKEHFARSRDLGLVLTADNVRKNMRFVCHCCSCCCYLLRGISRHGFTGIILTSGYIAGITREKCSGCGLCAQACPINAIAMVAADTRSPKRKQDAVIDTAICLGCGVCALKCPSGACRLTSREQRVITPESTFERVMLHSLEKGTLQNLLFDNPARIDQTFLRFFTGAFLRLPPVKRALLSDSLRSVFLATVKGGVRRQGRGWALEL